MTYPTIGRRRADHLVEELRMVAGSGDPTDIVLDEGDFVELVPGPEYPRLNIELSEISRAEWEVSRGEEAPAPADLWRLEARMAEHLHSTLASVTVELRADMGFWRYLALFPYRWFLVAREPEMKPQDYGGTREDTEDPTKRVTFGPKYQLLLRTYLWGKVAYDDTEDPSYRRATLVGDTGGSEIDIWHSHMIRTQLGHLGRVPLDFIDSICADPRANGRDPGRDVEKRLTRMKHNVLLDIYAEDGRSLVDEQKNIALNLPHGDAISVTKPVNPKWARDELILTLDLYIRYGALKNTDPKVIALSQTLNSMDIHADRPDAERFRNPNGVALKLANFQAIDPDYPGVGMTRGGRGDVEVWKEFRNERSELHEVTDAIRHAVRKGSIPH